MSIKYNDIVIHFAQLHIMISLYFCATSHLANITLSLYNKLNKTKTTQTKQRKEVKRMRTELMKDVKEFIKFNDLIHKDYDEVINEFSDENLTE